LLIALFGISPPVILIHTIFKPFMKGKIKRDQQRFLYLGIENKPAVQKSVAV
jgi:hypothetical protein